MSVARVTQISSRSEVGIEDAINIGILLAGVIGIRTVVAPVSKAIGINIALIVVRNAEAVVAGIAKAVAIDVASLLAAAVGDLLQPAFEGGASI